MLKPLVTIENWSRGMVPSPFEYIQGAGQLFQGLDPWTEPGYLKCAPAMEKDSGATVVDLPNYALEHNGDLFFLGDAGKLYRRSGIWAVEGTDGESNPGLGLGKLYDTGDTATYIYFASGANVGRYEPSGDVYDDDWLTAVKGDSIDSDTKYHPMKLWGDTLYIGAGRYIASMTEGATWTKRALTLPASVRVKSLAVIGNLLAIGTTEVPNSYNWIPRESPVFFWDGVSASFNNMITVNESYLDALYSDENVLYAFAHTRGGVIYVYTGARFEILRHMPNPGQDLQVFYAGGIDRHRDGIMFAMTHNDTDGEIKSGIWSLGRKRTADPLALEFKYPISTTRTDNTVTLGAVIDASNSLFIGWKDTTGGTAYGVDDLGVYQTATFESQIFSFDTSEPITFKGVIIEAKTIPSSCSIAIKYKIDNDTSWTTAMTYTSAEQGDFAPIKGSGRKLQIQAVLTPNGATSTPSLQRIMIF